MKAPVSMFDKDQLYFFVMGAMIAVSAALVKLKNKSCFNQLWQLNAITKYLID
jgi:hypothetical protein